MNNKSNSTIANHPFKFGEANNSNALHMGLNREANYAKVSLYTENLTIRTAISINQVQKKNNYAQLL